MKKFDPKSMKPLKLKKGIQLLELKPKEFLRSRTNISLALTECLVDGDVEAFHEIIRGYLSVINKEELSRKSKVSISTIHRVAAGSNLKIETLIKIMSATNKAA